MSTNDLFKFDPEALEWTQITNSAAGAQPVARDSHGWVASGGRLYLFGGMVYSGLTASVNALAVGHPSVHLSDIRLSCGDLHFISHSNH